MTSYGPNTDFRYVCTVTLTLEIWPWVMDNNCVKYYPDPTWHWGTMSRTQIFGMCALWPGPWRYDLGSRSWHTLGSWTTIVWNIIQIREVGKKLWPGHDVNRQTYRQGDYYIPHKALFAEGIISQKWQSMKRRQKWNFAIEPKITTLLLDYCYAFGLLLKPSGLKKFFEEGDPLWPIFALPGIRPWLYLA